MDISFVKIRRSWYCLIFIMAIPILVRWHPHTESMWYSCRISTDSMISHVYQICGIWDIMRDDPSDLKSILTHRITIGGNEQSIIKTLAFDANAPASHTIYSWHIYVFSCRFIFYFGLKCCWVIFRLHLIDVVNIDWNSCWCKKAPENRLNQDWTKNIKPNWVIKPQPVNFSTLIACQNCIINSLWPSEAIQQQRSGPTLVQVMACYLTPPSHYLNQCWLIISEIQWHSY